MGVLEVEPVTLHRKPFMYTASGVNNLSHVDLKSPLTLRRTTVHGMDPMPGTDTAAFGARRHLRGDREWGVGFPNALVVNAEDGQVLRLDASEIGSVRDGESATLQVINALRRKKKISGSGRDHPSDEILH